LTLCQFLAYTAVKLNERFGMHPTKGDTPDELRQTLEAQR
jgi:hypothetical protein